MGHLLSRCHKPNVGWKFSWPAHPILSILCSCDQTLERSDFQLSWMSRARLLPWANIHCKCCESSFIAVVLCITEHSFSFQCGMKSMFKTWLCFGLFLYARVTLSSWSSLAHTHPDHFIQLFTSQQPIRPNFSPRAATPTDFRRTNYKQLHMGGGWGGCWHRDGLQQCVWLLINRQRELSINLKALRIGIDPAVAH